MPISKKQKHRLIDICNRIRGLRNKGFVINILDSVEIEHEEIVLDVASKQMWYNIIDNVDQQNRIDALLSAVINQYDNISELKEIKEDIAKQSLESLTQHLRSIIQDRLCVLFIGPGMLRCVEGDAAIPFNKFLSRQLASQLDAEEIFYEPDDVENLSYIIDRYETSPEFALGDTEKFANELYEISDKPTDFYSKISEFNFPLVINTNPDIILPEMLGESRCISSYYDTSNSIQPKITGDYKGKTIVYNIYGSFSNPLSILFTEKEAVDFTRRAYEKNPPIPDEIKTIAKRSYGLFIGFDFKEWHLKILFDVLDLRNKPGNYSLSDTNMNIFEFNKEYYERQYNMTFLRNSITRFIMRLRQ